LHEKLDVSLVYAISLEAQLKATIPTICSTCEVNDVKKMELAHYVDPLQDENDELRKLMDWLSGHEPQLRIMIETYKCHDGEALGAKKVGEGSGESDIPEPPKSHHQNAFVPKPTHLRNRQDTTPASPMFPPQTINFQEPIKYPLGEVIQNPEAEGRIAKWALELMGQNITYAHAVLSSHKYS
jgi:hypothetical protein